MADFKHGMAWRIIKISNVVLMTVPFAVCWYGYYGAHTIYPFYNRGNWAMIALFLALYVIYGKIYDGFQISMNRIFEIIYSQGLAVIISDFIMYIITYLLTRHVPNPLPLLAALMGQLILASLWSALAHIWYFAVFPPKRSAVVYDKRPGLELLVSEYGLEKKFDIQVTVGVDACLLDLHMLDDMEVVFLSGVHSHERNIILKYCVEKEINTYVIPRIGDTIMSGAKQMHMFHLPILSVGWYKPPIEYLFLKRFLDILVSSVAIVLTSPIMLLTAVAIKAADGGPVFYRQCRLTKNGKEFFILKFRSMCVEAEKDGIARLSTGGHDNRITPVGRIIRKFRIDELPQLFNILSGSMTLVGPRPERPEIAGQYMEKLPEFALRLKAKAGLTGYSQVYGKYNTQPYDKLQMDLMYLAHPGIIEDLRIIFSTIKILFLPESTEGIAAGQTTAALEMDLAGGGEMADEKVEFDYRKTNFSKDKKNCLMILPRPIFPLVSGYSNKNYHLIRSLSSQYNLTLIVLSTEALCEEEIAYYQDHACRVEGIITHKYENGWMAFQYLFSIQPIQVGYYYKKGIGKLVKTLSKDSDIVIASLVRTVRYLEVVPDSCTKIFDMVDSIGLNYMHSFHQTTSMFWKLLYRIEGKRLVNYEKEQVAKAHCSFFVNQNEENFYRNYGKTAWLPHGVKEELFSYKKFDPRYEKSIVFMGKMDYQPNVDAAKWYIEKVHSRIGKDVPFIIVGANPSKELFALKRKYPNITITGYCEDPYVYLNSAMALVAPMQTGGGIQNKVLEGMALGKINIISTLAARPIKGGEDKKHFLVADTAQEYEAILTDLSDNPGKYSHIGLEAKKIIREQFTWSAYCDVFIQNIKNSESINDEEKSSINIYRKY